MPNLQKIFYVITFATLYMLEKYNCIINWNENSISKDSFFREECNRYVKPADFEKGFRDSEFEQCANQIMLKYKLCHCSSKGNHHLAAECNNIINPEEFDLLNEYILKTKSSKFKSDNDEDRIENEELVNLEPEKSHFLWSGKSKPTITVAKNLIPEVKIPTIETVNPKISEKFRTLPKNVKLTALDLLLRKFSKVSTYSRPLQKYVESSNEIYLFDDNNIKSIENYESLTSIAIDFAVKEVVDRYFNLHYASRRYRYVNTELGTKLMEDLEDFSERSPINHLLAKDKTIIMPINNGKSQWYLLVADTLKLIIEYYDPFDKELNFKKTAIDKARRFLTVLSRRNQFVKNSDVIDDNPDNWKVIGPRIEFSAKVDDFNCGVFIVLYIDCLINDRKYCPTDIMEYRKELRADIMRNCRI